MPLHLPLAEHLQFSRTQIHHYQQRDHQVRHSAAVDIWVNPSLWCVNISAGAAAVVAGCDRYRRRGLRVFNRQSNSTIMIARSPLLLMLQAVPMLPSMHTIDPNHQPPNYHQTPAEARTDSLVLVQVLLLLLLDASSIGSEGWGFSEDSLDSIIMIARSPLLLVLLLVYTGSLQAYNICGMAVSGALLQFVLVT
eukprot:GHUV01027324.1.p2 GENE.GHUV01027324.1~~GHUV01027324.1.p2  ORF type:complete len:194 (+),score=41.13 GHUV01027324.1:2595-3176(+)